MRICITAGPTREYLDPVRFLTNASSGRMGYALAGRAVEAGHQVCLLTGPVCLEAPAGVETERFQSVSDLLGLLEAAFPRCDALIMTAAVGDFRAQDPAARKLSRKAGPICVQLVPTPDVVASVAAGKRPDQKVVVFAVEDLPPAEAQAKAQQERTAKHADWVVVNAPEAMGAQESRACILGPEGRILDWDLRDKQVLAERIIRLLEQALPSKDGPAR